jgi:xylulokinase
VVGLLCALADGLAQLTTYGVTARRILLIGGGARSQALREIAPTVFGVPVLAPTPAEYVALGAARQAAWALRGSTTPPGWAPPAMRQYTAAPAPAVSERYAQLRDLTE